MTELRFLEEGSNFSSRLKSRLFALHYIVLILFYSSKNVLLWTIVMDTIHHPHMSSFGLPTH